MTTLQAPDFETASMEEIETWHAEVEARDGRNIELTRAAKCVLITLDADAVGKDPSMRDAADKMAIQTIAWDTDVPGGRGSVKRVEFPKDDKIEVVYVLV
jgi:hypothetical protein